MLAIALLGGAIAGGATLLVGTVLFNPLDRRSDNPGELGLRAFFWIISALSAVGVFTVTAGGIYAGLRLIY